MKKKIIEAINTQIKISGFINISDINNIMVRAGCYSILDDTTEENIKKGVLHWVNRDTDETQYTVRFKSDNTIGTDYMLRFLMDIKVIEHRMKKQKKEVYRYNLAVFELSQDVWESITKLMDNDKREIINSMYAPCTNVVFLKEYCKLDKDFETILKERFNIEII